MKTAIRFVIVLGLICLVMGGGVAILFGAFKDRIAEKKREAFNVALRQVLPAGGRPEPVPGTDTGGDDQTVYRMVDAEGNVLGYAARGQQQGYSSVVRVLVGFQSDGRSIHKVVVLEQQETPGLGANVSLARSDWTLWKKLAQSVGLVPPGEKETRTNAFLDQFSRDRDGSARTVERLDDIDAMTAATITSDAVREGVRKAARRVGDVLKKKEQRGGRS